MMSRTKLLLGIGFLVVNLFWILALPLAGRGQTIEARFQVGKPMNLPFLNDVDASRLLVFWGYVECGTVCPVSMVTLRQVYVDFRDQYPEEPLTVAFVGLATGNPIDRPDAVAAYAGAFHPDFRGFTLAGLSLSEALREFGVTWRPSLRNGDEISHTSFIYFLEKVDGEWILRHVYEDYPPDAGRILADLQKSVAPE
jgi:protein SCO1/2